MRRLLIPIVVPVLALSTACSGPDRALPPDRDVRAGFDAVVAAHPPRGEAVAGRRFVTLAACPLGRLPLRDGQAEAEVGYLQDRHVRIVCSDDRGGFVAITVEDVARFLDALRIEDGQLSEERRSFRGRIVTTVTARECQAVYTRQGSSLAYTAYLYDNPDKRDCVARLEKALPVITRALADDL